MPNMEYPHCDLCGNPCRSSLKAGVCNDCSYAKYTKEQERRTMADLGIISSSAIGSTDKSGER